jgi:hypothetical protein
VCNLDKATRPRPAFRRAHGRLALIVALAGAAHAQAALPGTDIRDWLTADISGKLSLAGFWIPIDTTAIMVGPYWSVIRLGASQREGVALGGFALNDPITRLLPNATSVRAALLEQKTDGLLEEASARLLGDVSTNGAGSVIAADFNGDGYDDLVLSPYNETPFVGKPTAVWISRSSGALDKQVLTDHVINHDARVVTLGGRRKILGRSNGASAGNTPFHPIYEWNGSTFSVDTSRELGGSSVAAGRFTGNADDWVIVGDSGWGPGLPNSATNAKQTYAYKFNAGVVTVRRCCCPSRISTTSRRTRASSAHGIRIPRRTRRACGRRT